MNVTPGTGIRTRVRVRRPLPALGAGLLALTLALAGCAGSGGSPADDAREAAASAPGDIPRDTEGTVRILMEEVPDTDIVESLTAGFSKEYPKIKVEIEKMAYDQMRDKLVASFRAPQPSYDLIVVDNPWMADFAKAGFIAPLDNRIKETPDYAAEDFFTPLTRINEVDGKTYAVPFYNYALGLIYREDLYRQAGMDAPKDLSGLVTAAKSLSSGDTSGIAMQPQRGYKIFEEWGNWLFAAGGSIYDEDGAPSLDTPEASKALEAYIDAYESAAPKNSLNWGFDEANRSVAAGKSAQMVGYNWNLPVLNKADGPAGTLAGKFALAPMPGGKQVLGSWNWAIPTNSAASDAAWAFTAHITSQKVDLDRVLAGGAPIRQSTLSDKRVLGSEYGQSYYDSVRAILADAEPLCAGENCDEMIQAVGTELNAAVAGKKSVKDALSAANAAAARIQGK